MAVELTDNIAPSGDSGGTPATFPTHLDTYGYGGYRSVADQNERLGSTGVLTELRRQLGMAVYQQDTAKLYILTTNPAGATTTAGDWTEFSGGGSDLITYDAGVLVTSTTTSYDFTGAGVLVSNVGDDVTIDIPGGAGPAYNWVVEDNATSTATIIATDTLEIKGKFGITTVISGVSPTYTLTLDASALLTDTLSTTKMWVGDASNEAMESDILSSSNTADSNYFAIIGDADTSFQIGDQPNQVNLLTEVYSRQLSTLILGKNNDGAHSMSSSVIIGTEAVWTAPASIFGGNVVIGNGAASDHSGVGDYIRNCVIIGQDAGHVAVPSGTYAAALQSTVVGTGAGNRVGNNDVMIGHSTGSNALQKSGSFSQLLIGTATYGCGDGAIVLGGAVSSGITSFNGGIGETMGMSAGPRSTTDYYSTIIGYQSTAKNEAVTIGYRSQALQGCVSIGVNTGTNWDDNTGASRNNIFIGNAAGQGNPNGDASGWNNIAIGSAAMRFAGLDGKTTPPQAGNPAERNIAIGYGAGNVLRSNGNVAIGMYSLESYYDTHYANYGNIAIGDEAAKNFELEGNLNVFIGAEAATAITTGTQNVVVGGQAAMSAMSSQNVILGHRAQYNNPTAGVVTGLVSKAVIIGEQAANDSPTEDVYSVNIGAESLGTTQDCIIGAGAIGYQGGIALGYEANQRNKGASGTNSYRNLMSISKYTAWGFNTAADGDATENAQNGNYCFDTNGEALAAGLKHGDIFVEGDGSGDNVPNNPARLCIVLETKP